MKGSSGPRLAIRLVISHLIVGVISIGLTASIAGHFIMESGRRDVENILEDTAFLLSNDLEVPFIESAGGNSGLADQLTQVIAQHVSNRREIYYAVYRPDLTKVVSNHSEPSAEVPPEVRAAQKEVDGEAIRTNANGQEIFFVAVPIVHEATFYGILQLGIPYDLNLNATYRSLLLLAVISGLLLVGVSIGAWWFSASFSRPILALTSSAEKLSAGQLHARADIQGPGEIQQFAATFNQMAERLEESMNALKAFVANASHELRTPLTAIKLHVEALADGAVGDADVAPRFLSQIQEEIDLMNRTVNDLLDLSQIEANRDQTQYATIDLAEILNDTRDFWRARSQQAGLELRLSLPLEIPTIQANEDQIRRLLNNLVENGIKYSQAGGWVEIGLFNLPRRAMVRIEVRDSGQGIPEDRLARIFERFYRVEMPNGRKTVGSGLGLAISKSIVEAHHGKIGVTSQLGTGSTFWVELPLQPGAGSGNAS